MSNTARRVNDAHLVGMIQRAKSAAARHKEQGTISGSLCNRHDENREHQAAMYMQEVEEALRELQALRRACTLLVGQIDRLDIRDQVREFRNGVPYDEVKRIVRQGIVPEGQDMSFRDISFVASIVGAIADGGVVQPKQPTETRNPGESIIRADITVKRRRQLIELYQGRIKAAVGRELARLQDEIQTQVTGVTFYEAHRLENGQAVYNCEIGVKP